MSQFPQYSLDDLDYASVMIFARHPKWTFTVELGCRQRLPDDNKFDTFGGMIKPTHYCDSSITASRQLDKRTCGVINRTPQELLKCDSVIVDDHTRCFVVRIDEPLSDVDFTVKRSVLQIRSDESARIYGKLRGLPSTCPQTLKIIRSMQKKLLSQIETSKISHFPMIEMHRLVKEMNSSPSLHVFAVRDINGEEEQIYRSTIRAFEEIAKKGFILPE